MIPAEYKSSLIHSGIEFIRSITEAYGAEKGMELWDTIASTLDPDIKGQIFFTLLTGDFGDRITIKGYQPGAGKVNIIKAIRTVTGLGLKEAKDEADKLMITNNGYGSAGYASNAPISYSPGKPLTLKLSELAAGRPIDTKNVLREAGCIL